MSNTTHFGFKEVKTNAKQNLVKGVFDSVSSNYDLMNDVLSIGVHRLWKTYTAMHSGLSSGDKVLDLAGGTGDMAYKFFDKVGKTGSVVLSDINVNMLQEGKKKLLNKGIYQVKFVQTSAENLAFANNSFNCVCIAFGLRNMTNKGAALKEAHRVLKTGGRLLVLEFSKIKSELLSQVYDYYSFNIMPKLGAIFADDEDSYRYLAESIRKHPDQETLKEMFLEAGFDVCEYYNLTQGIVSLHKGIKLS